MANRWLLACCLSAVLACSPTAQADVFDWLATVGVSQGTFYSKQPEVAVDAAGNTYVVGVFEDTVDFDPGPGVFELTSAGSRDVFVLKLNPAGEFAWAVHVGGACWEDVADVAVDDGGNVYVGGEFSCTADFDPGPGEYPLVAEGGSDIFLLKLTTAGQFAWVRPLTTEAGQSHVGALFVTNDRIYMAGEVVYPADFDPGPGVLELEDTFVWTLDQDGALVWAVGGIEAYALDVTVAGGFVYATGMFWGTVDFNPGPGVYWLEASWCAADIFVLKLSLAGDFIWARGTHDTTGCTDYTWDNEPTGIAVDGEGNLYTVGDLGLGGVDFDPGPGVFYLNQEGFFLWKLDQAGHLVWATHLGAGTSHSHALDLAIDPGGNLYVTGRFYGTVDFDPGPGEHPLNASPGTDAYVLRLTEDAEFSWVGQMSGSELVSGTSLDVDVPNIHSVGLFTGVVDFDPGPGTAQGTAQGDGADIFALKLSPGEVCGDGVLDPGEQCDDGNTISCDGCSFECVSEAGLDCGDGILNEACGEECDDGNNVPGDGCSDECELPCGDGVLDPGEECDDGNDIDGDGCQSNCLLPVCGDGILDPDEQCDDGNNDSGDGCRADCVIPACGDGILDPGEQCDDGNNDDGDSCRADCRNIACGNGIVETGEECDDGNNIDGDGCESDCTVIEVPVASYESLILLAAILFVAGTVVVLLQRGSQRGGIRGRR